MLLQRRVASAAYKLPHPVRCYSAITGYSVHPQTGAKERTKSQVSAQARIARIDRENPLPSSFLVDNFNRQHTYLRISLTEKCNLRCTYCMPEDGVSLSPPDSILTTSEILRIARLFVQEGVTKVRLTGGEPTLRRDLGDIIDGLNELKAHGLEKIGMTTNAVALKRKVSLLRERGLDQINISLDTLDPFKFELLTRRRGLQSVLDSIQAAVTTGFDPVKLNVVIIRGVNDMEAPAFVEMTKSLPLYVRFIEYMPFGGNKWNERKLVPYQEMLGGLGKIYPDIIKIDDEKNDTSKAYTIPGHQGKFGFITSMSEHFCGTCNRLRLLADGNLKVCLFGNAEVNLRDALRSGATDQELLETISAAVKRKKKQHADPISLSRWSAIPSSANRLPYLIPRMPGRQVWKRAFSGRANQSILLTHVDDKGKANMVDVSSKPITARTATASGQVTMDPKAFGLIKSNTIAKGDVLTVAQIAGIQAAKQTGTLIPLCHPIPLSGIDVKLTLDEQKPIVHVVATVSSHGQTGVEMEALVAVSVACCTVFDMCKAVDKNMVIEDVRVIAKSGGKSGGWSSNNSSESPV
ncbi:hypothetical protein DFS34DRAFT_272259 [Phlyctochytrium arcticum]|nr:hypothetical protein DFS34DRAFT_272259 [Phlyctochytrium arcticum]